MVKYNFGGFYINNNETNSAAHTAFGVGGTERMRIVSSGNVGIGTTTPTSRLFVQEAGDVRQLVVRDWVDISASSGGQALFASNMYRGGLTNDFRYGATHASIGAAGMAVNWPAWRDVSFVSDGTSNPSGATTLNATFTPTANLVIKTGGNVGIGTVSPQARLDVSHTGSAVAGAIRIGDPATLTNNTGLYGRTSGVFTLGSAGGDIVLDTNYGSAERIRIQHSTGNVGIGTTGPASKLTVRGTSGNSTTFIELTDGTNFRRIYLTATSSQMDFNNGSNTASLTAAGAWTNASDKRLKTDIRDTRYGLETAMKLRPVDYVMKSDGTPQIGFIAQDVEQVVPELVIKPRSEQENYTLSYGNMTAVAIKAIQELKTANDNLTLQVNELRGELEALKAAR